MAKRLSDKEKIIILECFVEGKSIDNLAEEFDCTKLTISRNLKRSIGEQKYKELNNKNKKINKSFKDKKKINLIENKKDPYEKVNGEYSSDNYWDKENLSITPFTELAPLNYEIDNVKQKDFSSVPICEVDFPNILYMIVDKKFELETKYLKEYPHWEFASQEELNRKTIEVHIDLKIAKRLCNKEQKVIKIPNTEVFKIVAPLLLNKGISRIVNAERLIAL